MKQYDSIFEIYLKSRREHNFSSNEFIEKPKMLKLIGDIKNLKLLDLGCGFGDHAKEYSKRGAFVEGVDTSKKEIDYAIKQKIKKTNFQILDINKKLPFRDAEFDIITCSLVLDHIKNLKPIFRECFRVLKKNGRMVFSVPNPILYQEKYIAGILKEGNKRRIFGNYFKRRKIRNLWRLGDSMVSMEWYHKPSEDYFKAFLGAGFRLEDYNEPIPIPLAKKLFPESYETRIKNPYFLFFSLRKP